MIPPDSVTSSPRFISAIEIKLPPCSATRMTIFGPVTVGKIDTRTSNLRASKVMVGEIRDYETAAIAIQVSLTGHFVLSTLHKARSPTRHCERDGPHSAPKRRDGGGHLPSPRPGLRRLSLFDPVVKTTCYSPMPIRFGANINAGKDQGLKPCALPTFSVLSWRHTGLILDTTPTGSKRRAKGKGMRSHARHPGCLGGFTHPTLKGSQRLL